MTSLPRLATTVLAVLSASSPAAAAPGQPASSAAAAAAAAARVDEFDSLNCRALLRNVCSQHSDCEDDSGVEGAKKDCGTAKCDDVTGACTFTAHVSNLTAFPQCADTYVGCGTWQGTNLPWVGDDSKCDRVPTGFGSLGRCNGYNNNECNYKWCIGDAKPTGSPTLSPQPSVATTPKPTLYSPDPAYDDYTCPQGNKCNNDNDCKDPNHQSGANDECGWVYCDKTKNAGVCRFGAWKAESQCEDTYMYCVNSHALCYKGPRGLDFYGSCSDNGNSQCLYAFCPGVAAKEPTPEVTPAPTMLAGITDVPLSITVTVGGSAPTLTAGGNVLLKATATFAGEAQPRDVTGDCDWTSSSPAVADFGDFPALLWGKVQGGQASVTAALNGVSGSIALTVASGTPSCGVRTVGMKVLVIRQSVALDNVRGAETVVPAIERALGYIGVPYDLYRNTDMPDLAWTDSECVGNYQAVIVSDGGLRWQPPGFFDSNGLHLEQYCDLFNVRTINWFTWPSESFGWIGSTSFGTAETRQVTLTAAGQGIFDYMNPGHTVQLEYVWNQVATPLPGSTPLLVDSQGYAYASLFQDGAREMLTMTFGSNQYTRHMTELSYGVINWATRGRFIGFRRVYIRADMDDYFIDDDIFDPSVPCGTATDSTGFKWRMNSTDLQGVVDWQVSLKNEPVEGEVVIDMVYNGIGSTGHYSFPDHTMALDTKSTTDTLTPLTKATEQNFRWVGHGWNHLNEDKTSYETARQEVYHNLLVATKEELDFTHFDPQSMVTGQVSGLKNPNFLNAASDLGVRYLVSDTSRVETIDGVVYDENPGMNRGLYNWFQPKLFMIPRRPNNLFYNVALRAEWVHEYNCIFNSFWGRDLSLDEIIDIEAETLVGYLLSGEKYPWMFHQANMRIYFIENGIKKFLLEELFDAVFAKYKAVYNLPITSPAMSVLGKDVISHNEIGTHNVRGVYAPGLGCLLRADAKTRTPCTGFSGDENRIYGGQNQCYAHLFPNTPRFVPES